MAASYQRSRIPARAARTLVAEDHPLNHRLLIKALNKLGFRDIAVVENGQRAVEASATNPYDLMVMDCQMPVLDGYGATSAIRAQEQEIHTWIIAMTADASPDDHVRCMEAGMDGCLGKPLDIQQLQRTLEQWFVLETEGTTVAIPADAKSPIDEEQLMRVAGTREEIKPVLALFFELANEKLQVLLGACDPEGKTAWQSAAHYLNGSAGSIGMPLLQAVCRDAEMDAGADPQRKRHHCEQIRAELERACLGYAPQLE